MTQLDRLAAKTLQRATRSVRETPDSPEARASAIAAMQEAMRAAPPRRSMRWPVALAAAASLVAVAGGGLWSRPVIVAHVVSTGAKLEAGALVESDEQPLQLELVNGLELSLAPQSAVQLGMGEATEVLLRRGAVAAEMVSADRLYAFDCGDTKVIARRAKLTLQRGAGCDGRTKVEVLDGEASASGVVLKAGTLWPQCAETKAPVLEPAPAVVEPVKVEPPKVEAPVRPKRTNVAPPPRVVAESPAPPPVTPEAARQDALARQNALYLEAISLHRAGAIGPALEKLELVLREKDSPLAETALVQKMRWLAPARRDEARAAARDYLRQFPMGFGRAEAEQLLVEKP